jgi:hypothetical protein
MVTERPDERWQALLVAVASNSRSYDRSFAQSLNSQAEFARALEQNMPGLRHDDLIVLPEPRHAHEVTEAIALLNDAYDEDVTAGLARPGLLFYYCGHGMNANGQLYLSMVETIDEDAHSRRTGLALRDVLDVAGTTGYYERHRVALILDCCFAGLARVEPAARRADLLMAVGPEHKAKHDPDGTGPTYFTGALVELMREGDPTAGPWIDLPTAHRSLGPRLVERYGEQRQPYLYTGGSGPVVLGPNAAYTGPP